MHQPETIRVHSRVHKCQISVISAKSGLTLPAKSPEEHGLCLLQFLEALVQDSLLWGIFTPIFKPSILYFSFVLLT